MGSLLGCTAAAHPQALQGFQIMSLQIYVNNIFNRCNVRFIKTIQELCNIALCIGNLFINYG